MKRKPEQHRPTASPSSSAPRGEVAAALAEVLEDQAQKAKRRAEAPRPPERRSGPVTVGTLLVLSAFSAYLWLGNPDWLQPAPVAPPSPLAQEAGMRMEVYLQAVRVREFQAREARLPVSLAEAGDPFTDVRYERLIGDLFRLSLSQADSKVGAVYLSSESLEDFLGNAPQVIRGTVK